MAQRFPQQSGKGSALLPLFVALVLLSLFVAWLLRTPAPPKVDRFADRWERLPSAQFPPHPWGYVLKGRTIGLDPGHGGGQDEEGKVGQAFEGAVNLRVALALREWLERDGATVLLSREEDIAVTLKERPQRLEAAGAEIFISLHHNAAPPGVEPNEVNYTSTFYHGGVDHEPASLDLARSLQGALVEALRTGHRVPTPILSDHNLYPKNGFAVLRHATVPAVLCEASFYTQDDERERLQDPTYVEREAYGYYRALVDYFTGGTPTARLKEASAQRAVFLLDDGVKGRGGWGADRLRILESSLSVSVGGERAPFRFERKEGRLTVDLPSGTAPVDLRLHFQNLYKHSNYPSRYTLRQP